MKPEDLVRPEILALKAYHVPEFEATVKLDAMENPYSLPLQLRRELANALSRADLNRYPDPTGKALRALLARKMAVPEGMELLLGNGSDDLLHMVAAAVARPDSVMMYPSPTFVVYGIDAALTGMRAVAVPLREDFTFDAEAFIERMQAERPALVFIAYPNNPTGGLIPDEDLEKVIRAAPGLVVIDEAYHPFAQKSYLSRLPEFENLVVVRTMSKLGLAGIRLGYLAARPEWVEQFNKVRQAYNVGVLTQVAATFMLERLEVLEEQAARIRSEREKLGKALAGMKGVTVFPSEANFFLFRVPDPERTFEALKQQGILIKMLHPGLPGCLRTTVGTPEENRILVAALKESL